ncbi:ferulic acid esterase (FaeA) [Venturia nashicola]|uniref:feruloyl esterase n=1 Tax=Venturia nashicola TaxID=86259 RepID=A0A4Z1P5B0_9PEZI|nr:ferulic acid esterase (FaeA) [Venturia nashicola]
MMLFSSALLLGALSLARAELKDGCSRPFDFPAQPGGPSKGIKIGERIVRISVPKNYEPTRPAPLILAYHDKGMTAEEMEKLTHLSNPLLNPDYIVVYPEAVESKWLSDEDADLKVDDKSFISNLVDGLTERLCIDKDRVHMTGLGTGGGISHHMACDPYWSNKTASFALVNPTILAGLITKSGVKDEINMLWEKCKPARVPVKLLEVHGENNTLNSYWGAVAKSKRGRLGVVQWLVEWAMRNECGDAKGIPAKGKDDLLYRTELSSGTIYEGATHPNKLQRAMYRCYALTEQEQIDKYVASFQIIDNNAETMVPLNPDVKEEPQKDRGDIVLEHVYVKNYGHGWPRIAMKDGKTETFDTTEKEESEDAPIFDVTKEVLRWFSQNKLSDESRAPGIAMNYEPALDDETIEKLVSGITAQVEQKQKEIGDGEVAAEAHQDEAVSTGKIGEGNGVKDEL